MEKLHIKCKCGRNEKLTEEHAERLPWTESQTLKCNCGKELKYLGHQQLKNTGVAWIS